MPTETVYGLAADATNRPAIARIFAAKGRPVDHPLIVHLADPQDLDRWAPDASDRCPTVSPPLLARSAHPDRAAIRICCRRRWPEGATRSALRVPAHPMARELIRLGRRPAGSTVGQPVRRGEPDDRRARASRPRRRRRRDPRRWAVPRRRREHDRRHHGRSGPGPTSRCGHDRARWPLCSTPVVAGASGPPGRAGCWRRTTHRSCQVRLVGLRRRRRCARSGDTSVHAILDLTARRRAVRARSLLPNFVEPTTTTSRC